MALPEKGSNDTTYRARRGSARYVYVGLAGKFGGLWEKCVQGFVCKTYRGLVPTVIRTSFSDRARSVFLCTESPIVSNACRTTIARGLSSLRASTIKPSGSLPPPIWKKSLKFTCHPASLNTVAISSANISVSGMPVNPQTPAPPFGFAFSILRSSFRCSAVNVRGLTCFNNCRYFTFASAASFSKFAVRPCCADNSVCTRCCSARASDAAFCKPATFPLSEFRSFRSVKLSCSSFCARSFALPAPSFASPARSLACAALLLASAIRASASLFTASWYLFPARYKSTVPTSVNKSKETYATNRYVCCVAALSISGELDWIVDIAITVFTIGAILIAIAAIIEAFRRLKTIREQEKGKREKEPK